MCLFRVQCCDKLAGVWEKVRSLLDKTNNDDVQTCIEFVDNELQTTTFADHTEDAPVRRIVQVIQRAHELKLENQELKTQVQGLVLEMEQKETQVRGLVLENDQLRRRNVMIS